MHILYHSHNSMDRFVWSVQTGRWKAAKNSLDMHFQRWMAYFFMFMLSIRFEIDCTV